MVQPQYDRGEALGSSVLSHIRIVLTRSVEQQNALDRFEQELQDKSSPNYHKWLTPQEFGRRFGPTDSDIVAIVAWLQSHGLIVEPVSPGRTNIAFSGTVRQVENAFDT
jgi:subtilase family serine protease